MSEELVNARRYSAGVATAYGAAVEGGYTGTYAEFCAEQALFAENAQQVAEDRETVEQLVETFETDTVPGAAAAIGEEAGRQINLVADKGTEEVDNVHQAGNEEVGRIETTISPYVDQAEEAKDNAVAAKEDAVAAKQSIENLTVSASTLATGEPANVQKTVDPQTGVTNLAFGLPRGEKGDTGYPTDAQVETAVDSWLGENISQETGYVLDRTLTSENAAAPADLVGDLKESTNDLKTDFNDSTGNGEIEINLNQAIRCGTSPVNFNDFTGGSDYKHALLNVTPGDKFRISGGSIGVAARLYCFTDDNGVIKENADANITVNDLLITAPEGSTKLIINYALLSPNPVTAIYGDWLVNDVRQVVADNKAVKEATTVLKDDKTVVSLTNNDGYVLNTDGSVSAYQTGWWVTDQTDISSFKSLLVTACSGYNHLLYAFYNASGTFLSGENSGSDMKTIVNKTVAIPANAKYIRISSVYPNQTSALIGVSNIRLENNANLEKWNEKTWVVIGDSLTEKNNTALIKYYDYISDETGIAVNVQAHSGTGYANPGITDNFLTRAQTVPIDANVYTIFGSFNDYEYSLTNNIEIGTETDTGTDTLCGYFNSTISALVSRNPLINIGIVSPCPWVSVNEYNRAGNGFGKQYCDALKAVAERWSIPFLNLYECSGLRPWNTNFVAEAYTKDSLMGVHPDETGHKILSTKFKEFLEMLLA